MGLLPGFPLSPPPWPWLYPATLVWLDCANFSSVMNGDFRRGKGFAEQREKEFGVFDLVYCLPSGNMSWVAEHTT